MKRKSFVFLFFIVFIVSCIGKYQGLILDTKPQLIMPIAFGQYSLADLFYGIDEPNNLVIETGVFHQITDTIPFNNSLFFSKIENAELIFRVNNIMPFQVDLVITPFDTISNSKVGNELYVTIVEASAYNESSLSLYPIVSEHSLFINADQIEVLKNSNGLLIEAVFIWPYEKVVTSIIDDFFDLDAFNIKLILNAQLNLQ